MLTGEHGVGRGEARPDAGDVHRGGPGTSSSALKCAFDPAQILNPGKVFPTTPSLRGARPHAHPPGRAAVPRPAAVLMSRRALAGIEVRVPRCLPALHQRGHAARADVEPIGGREAPPSTPRTTRSRRSIEYGRVIHSWPPQTSSQLESPRPPTRRRRQRPCPRQLRLRPIESAPAELGNQSLNLGAGVSGSRAVLCEPNTIASSVAQISSPS